MVNNQFQIPPQFLDAPDQGVSEYVQPLTPEAQSVVPEFYREETTQALSSVFHTVSA